jgi:hypothetical protein
VTDFSSRDPILGTSVPANSSRGVSAGFPVGYQGPKEAPGAKIGCLNRGSVRPTSTGAAHAAAAGNDLVPAVLPIRGNRGGVAAARRLGTPAGVEPRHGDIDRYISDLSRPNALTASLNWYRANLAPRMPGSPPNLPPVEAPTLGIWSTNDHYLDGEPMKMSGRFVKGPWRYEQIDGASQWIPLDASDRLNRY